MNFQERAFSPEREQEKERSLLDSLTRETLFWMDPKNPRRLTGDHPMYRALTNHNIENLAERKQWIAKIKREFARIQEEKQNLEEAQRVIIEEDAALHEQEIDPEIDHQEAA